MRVRAFDEKRAAATAAKDYIAKILDAQVQKGRLAADAGQAALDRISLADDLAQLAQANVIIEAVVERLDVKQALFAKLDSMTAPDTILASNTSSIPITAIAAACKTPSACAACTSSTPCRLCASWKLFPASRPRPG
jgi:3-hydroxybutyryl-CoA dehydrogenase